jgi:membrane protein
LYFRNLFWVYPRQIVRTFFEIKGFFLAQAIAFKAIVVSIPVAVLGLGILSEIFRNRSILDMAAGLLQELTPAYLNEIIYFFENIQETSGTITLIGAAGSLVFATFLMNTLCEVITIVFATTYHERRSFLRQYALSVRMVLQVGGAFLLTLVLSFLIQTLNASGLSFLQQLGIDSVWVQTGWRRSIKFMGILIPFLLTLTMFFQLYFFIPKPHPPFKSVFWGALITAIFWELAKSLFTLYASNFAFFNQYRQDSSLGLLALGDTVGLIIAVLLWVYYSGIVLIVGGILVMQLEKRAIKHNTNQETTP